MARAAGRDATGYAGLPRHQRAVPLVMTAGVLALAAWLFAGLGGAWPVAPRVPPLRLILLPPPPAPPPPRPLPHPPIAPRLRPRAVATAGSPGQRHRLPPRVLADPAQLVIAALPSAPAPAATSPAPAGWHEQATGDTGGAGGTGNGPGAGDGTGGDRPAVRLSQAVWVEPPDPRDFRREWPRHVPVLAAPVEVELVCAVTRHGRPHGCRVAAESLAGFGYGAAAVRLAEGARVRPVLANGQWTTLPVLISIAFLPAHAAG